METQAQTTSSTPRREPWNKGKLIGQKQKCADIRMRYLGVATPTSTTVGVTRLAGPDFMIEIEAVAIVNSCEAGPGRRRCGGPASLNRLPAGQVAQQRRSRTVLLKGDWLLDNCPTVALVAKAEAVTAAKYRAAATAIGCRGKCGRAAAHSGAGRCYVG